MRILYVIAHYPPDFVSGATLQVQRLAEEAVAAGHDVAVFSGAIRAGLEDGATADDSVNGVGVRWLGTAGWIEQDDDRNWDNPSATEAAAAMLDDFAPDVVHAHALQTIGAGVIDAALDRGIRVVLTMHDLWWWCPRLFLVDRNMMPCTLVTDSSGCACARSAEWRLERARTLQRTLARVDEILVPSGAMRDLAIANGVDPRRVGVDANDVETGSHPARSAEAHPDVRFVYVGGDHPVKGVDVVLAAASHLKGVRGWSLTCYGVAERRMRRHVPVSFQPPYEPAEAGAIFAASDVLVIPSIARESFSIAAREALAAGATVVTSDCLGPEEVVAHERNGLVVPTGDASALAATMRRLIDDRRLLAALQTAAAQSAPELRTPAEHAHSLLARYCGGPPRFEPTPERVVLICAGDPTGRLLRLAGALDQHGVAAAVSDTSGESVTDAIAGADAVLVHGPIGEETARALADAARSEAVVVVDDAGIVDCVTAAEIAAATGTEPAPHIGLFGGARIVVTIIAGADDAARTVANAVRGVVERRRRTELDVAVASDLTRLRRADVVVIPASAEGNRAWMLASLASAASIVDAELEDAVESERTALVARSDADWGAHVERLLDDPVLRASLASAARRQVLLHHGPHSVASSALTAIATARKRHRNS